MNNYTTKTASIRATVGDICKLNSRVIDSKEIKLDGTDIKDLLGFQDPEDFKDLTKRNALLEGDDYILVNDSGNVAYMSFADELTDGNQMFIYRPFTGWDLDMPKLTRGTDMFSGCEEMESFSGSLESLVDGSGMFHSNKIASFNSDLSSLKGGKNMFLYNELDLKSLCKIATTIKDLTPIKASTADSDWSDAYGNVVPVESRGIITLGFTKDIGLNPPTENKLDAETFNALNAEIAKFSSLSAITTDMSEIDIVNTCVDLLKAKMWNVYLTEEEYDDTDPGTYGAQYSRSWAQIMGFDNANLTRINNNILYDGNTEIYRLGEDGINSTTENIISVKAKVLNYKNYGMLAKTALQTFISPLTSLKYGNRMFNECGSLTTFDPTDLNQLLYGDWMFNSCASLAGWTIPLPEMRSGSTMFALCTRLTSWNLILPKLRNGSYMFNSSGLTTFTSDLPKLTGSYCMFARCANLTSFDAPMPKLIKHNDMFNGCTALKTFISNLDSFGNNNRNMFRDARATLETFDADMRRLSDGSGWFAAYPALTTFRSAMPNLRNGNSMFDSCPSLTTFDAKTDLYALRYANSMFRKTPISSWTYEVPNLKTANYMFAECTNFTSFATMNDLYKLRSANYMFYYTPINGWVKDMPMLKNAKSMFEGCKSIATFSGNIKALEDGERMFMSSSIPLFDEKTPKLKVGIRMFKDCTTLTSFTGDLRSLQDGTEMFMNTGIINFDADLRKLKNSNSMFDGCTSLTYFNGDLRSIKSAVKMFKSTNLKRFDADLSSLTNSVADGGTGVACGLFNLCANLEYVKTNLPKTVSARGMCYGCTKLHTFICPSLESAADGQAAFASCSALTTFNSKLDSLTNGYEMFMHCTSLNSFDPGDNGLTKLVNGEKMFSNCRLDSSSCQKILVNIPTYTDNSTHKLQLGVHKDDVDAVVSYLNGLGANIQLVREANGSNNAIAVVTGTSTNGFPYKGWTIGIWSANYYAAS